MKDLEQMRMKIFRIIVVIFLAVLPTMMLAGGKKLNFSTPVAEFFKSID
jgi:hypothetical protein